MKPLSKMYTMILDIYTHFCTSQVISHAYIFMTFDIISPSFPLSISFSHPFSDSLSVSNSPPSVSLTHIF